jgi:hypothetical protein
VLLIKLARTGPVLLSGDLYHYPEERTLDRVPTFDVNPDQTRRTRTAIEAFLKKGRTQFWIQHDYTANAALKKVPAFYDYGRLVPIVARGLSKRVQVGRKSLRRTSSNFRRFGVATDEEFR